MSAIIQLVLKIKDFIVGIVYHVGFGPEKAEDINCPVCGYYCLGKGGMGCIDKPFLVKNAAH